MSYNEIRAFIKNEADNEHVNRVWWLISRIKLPMHRIRRSVQLLAQFGADRRIVNLTEHHYQQLYDSLFGGDVQDPKRTIDRHIIRNLAFPFHFITRHDSISQIRLTPEGRELLSLSDPRDFIEKRILRKIKFEDQAWQPRTYEWGFNIFPYHATLQAVQRTDGFITHKEFGLFLARSRRMQEAMRAAQMVNEYRTLNSDQQAELESLLINASSDKTFHNAVEDQSNHTFTIFSHGTSFQRNGSRLELVTRYNPQIEELSEFAKHLDDDTVKPPPPANDNPGHEAESLVYSLLRQFGWRVTDMTREGMGFDLLATPPNTQRDLYIEVKSTVNNALSAINLTENEYHVASQHGNVYFIFIVENVLEEPRITWLHNPVSTVSRGDVSEDHVVRYSFPRATWISHVRSIGGLETERAIDTD